MPVKGIPCTRGVTKYLTFSQFFHFRKLCITPPDLGEHKTSQSMKDEASTRVTKWGTKKAHLLNLQIKRVTQVLPHEPHVSGVKASRQAAVSVHRSEWCQGKQLSMARACGNRRTVLPNSAPAQA